MQLYEKALGSIPSATKKKRKKKKYNLAWVWWCRILA